MVKKVNRTREKKSKAHTGRPPNPSDNIATAFILNSLFIVLEIIGGIMTNSMAILSDALHDLGDSLSLGLAWYFQKLSSKKKDKKFTFGYRRFSLLGAVINSLVLFAGSVFVLNETIPRLFHPQYPDTRGMFILALLGIAVNGLAALKVRKGKSINEKVVSLHLLEDVLSWAAVLAGSVVMMTVNFPALDPILSILITLFILTNVFKNLKTSFRVFLQGAPDAADITAIEKRILEFPEVDSIHDIHVWTMDGQYNILTLHLVLKDIDNQQKIREIKQQLKQFLKNLRIDHITIEIDQKNEECYLDECK
jgi:cobalt-zinc-cadmium efflux system protein